MEKVAEDLKRMERDSWGRNGEDKTYGRAAQEVYKAFQLDAMERQAEYGDKPVSKLCPVMSRTHGGWNCEREKCAWWYGVEECCSILLIAGGINGLR